MAIILESRRRHVPSKLGRLECINSGINQFHQSSVYLYDLTSICWYESVLEMLPLIFFLHIDYFNSIMGYLLWMLSFGSLLFVRHIISWLTYTQERSYASREKYRIVKNGWLTVFFALLTLQIFNSVTRDFLLMAVVAYGFYTVTDFADVADKFIVDIDPDRGARDIKYVVSETLLRILSKLTILGGVIAFFYIQEVEIALRVMFGFFLLSKLLSAGVFIICFIETRQRFANEKELNDNKIIVVLCFNLLFEIISLGLPVLIWDPEWLLTSTIITKGIATFLVMLSSFLHDRSLYFRECKAKGDSIIKILFPRSKRVHP
jgi:hypothetical protein